MKKKIIIIIVVGALIVSSFTPIIMFFMDLLKTSNDVNNINHITVNLEVSVDNSVDKKQYKTDKTNMYDLMVQTTIFTFSKDEQGIERVQSVNGKDIKDVKGNKFYIYKNDIEVKDDLKSIPIYENDTINIIDKAKE